MKRASPGPSRRLAVGVGTERPAWFLERVLAAEARIDIVGLDQAEAVLGAPERGSPAALAALVRANPGLRWVHTMPAGGGASVREAGLTPEELARVVFTTSAGVHAPPLSEFALFGVLAGAKRLEALEAARRERRWAGDLVLAMLDELTVLVVGVGGIGLETARKLQSLGCRVIGVSRHEVEGLETVSVEKLADAAAGVDAIVLALPSTDLTRGIVSAEVLARARAGVTIVNVGRGSTIDEPALVEALQSGQVGLAVLDVTDQEPLPEDSPLWSLPNVILSPHVAAVTDGNDRRTADLFADNARRYLDGMPLRNALDTVEWY